MSKTFKDRQKRYYRVHKHATYRRGLSMWADDFSKRKDKEITRRLRNKLKRKDKKEIKEYLKCDT